MVTFRRPRGPRLGTFLGWALLPSTFTTFNSGWFTPRSLGDKVLLVRSDQEGRTIKEAKAQWPPQQTLPPAAPQISKHRILNVPRLRARHRHEGRRDTAEEEGG